MSSVVFESAGPQLEVECPPGKRLLDLCDETDAPVPFSCRSTSCSTCLIEVLEGGEALTDPRDEELDVLEQVGHESPRYRLACSVSVRLDALPDTRIRLRALGE